MIELLRTADPVRLSFIRMVLEHEGIASVVLDANTGALYQAAIPIRVMVSSEDLVRAERVIRAAEPIG